MNRITEACVTVIVGLAAVTAGYTYSKYHDKATDPALTELQEVYTDVVFFGDRTGFCHKDPKYTKAAVGSMTLLPRITRMQSYDQDCVFLDQWIATDKTGEVETGHVLCGKHLQEKPPFKFCNIWEDL